MARKTKDDSKAPADDKPAHAPEAETGGVPPVEATAGGTVPAATDAPPEQKRDGGADNAVRPPADGGETWDIAYPPPAQMPERMLVGARLVVKAKPARGRWRAGRHFTREAVEIPLGDLTDDQRAALAGDPELVVSLRLVKPD